MSDQPPRKLLEKQQRREAEEKKRLEEKRAARRRNLVTLGIVVVVLAGVIALVLRDRSGTATRVGVAAAEAGCGDVERPQEQEAAHIEVGTEHPPYSSNPPTSGPHYASPGDAAFYTTAIEPETVVHNLEHGQIVFWYRPDASQELLDQLERVVRQEALASIGVPWPQIEEPYNFAITAWGAIQQCEQVSQEVIDEFRREFQGKGPENVGVPRFDG